MRLLFFSNVFPSPLKPTKGVFNLGLVQALTGLGHCVEVVAPIAWTEVWRASSERRRLLRDHDGELGGLRASYPTYFYTPGVFRSAYGYFMWRGVRGELRNSIRRVRPDAIVAYWAHPDGQCAVRAAREAGIPAVVMCGGSDVLLLTASRSRRRAIECVLTDADAVVPMSGDIRRRLIDNGMDERKISVVRRGVNLERFAPGDRQEARGRLGLETSGSYLLWVGRVEPVKGLHVLLAALQLLKERGVAVRMLLVGAGGQSESLQAEAQRRGIADRLEWLGAVPHEQLPDYYRAADLTILPSLSEGVPNVLLESIACGTPFVASDVGGIPEIATAGLDRLVLSNNATALATAIREKLSGDLMDEPRRFMPDDWPRAANRLIEVISPLVRTVTTNIESNSACLPPSIA